MLHNLFRILDTVYNKCMDIICESSVIVLLHTDRLYFFSIPKIMCRLFSLLSLSILQIQGIAWKQAESDF